MKKLLYILSILLPVYGISQDVSDAELKKAEQRARSMAAQAMRDPRYKQAIAAEAKAEEQSSRFPSSRVAVPALTTSSLPGYLFRMYSTYRAAMPAAVVQDFNKNAARYNNNAEKLAAASVSYWYNGKPGEAVLLATRAAMQHPSDELNLNNLGAMLNMSGGPLHSLPILKMLVAKHPKNPMLLNNLGQAYAGAGNPDSAMYFLGRCIQRSPQHPEANNTMGQIEKQRGHVEQAKNFFRTSLKGSYNQGAAQGLDEVTSGDGTRWMPAVASPVHKPYFNADQFKLPRQCTGPLDAPFIKAEHHAYVNMLTALQSELLNIASSEEEKGRQLLEASAKEMQHKIMQAISNKTLSGPMSVANPFQAAMQKKYVALTLHNQVSVYPAHEAQMKKLNDIYQELIHHYETSSTEIDEKYAMLMAQYECGEGLGAGCAAIDKLAKERCKLIIELQNDWQGKISAAKRDMQAEKLRFLQWQFDVESYYGFVTAPNGHLAKSNFANAAASYLRELKALAFSPYVIAYGDCNGLKPEEPAEGSGANVFDMQCPIDIDIPFVVGKLELNCENFAFSAGEGVIFKIEKDFASKQSTMTISAGLQFEGEKEWGVFTASTSAELTQSFYITWDGDNKITDAGIAIKAEASVESEGAVDLPYGVGGDYTKESIFEHKAELGYTLGINSGWTFNDAYLQSAIKNIGALIKK